MFPTTAIEHKIGAKGLKYEPEPAAVREWATNKGLGIGKRGPIPTEVFDAYVQAHTPTGRPRKVRA